MVNTSPTELTNDGAWCWFQDPRAVRHVGDHDRTYTGWITVDGDVEVGFYDHGTDEVRVRTLHADFEKDDHDAPTFYFDSEDRVLVFYSGHAGPEICFRRSEDPEALSFGPERSIAPSDGHTYPDPRRIDDTLYLFYRNAEGSVAYVVSEDDGRSWSDEQKLITTDGRDWCVYRKISDVHDGAIDMGLTYAEGGRHEPHRSIRHVRFDGDKLSRADGSVLSDAHPITFWDAPLVYDSDETEHDAWIWDCSAASGDPELVYAELRSESDHAYRYARWTGEQWRDEALADGGSHIVGDNPETYYSGGVSLDHGRPGVCYYSTGDHDGSTLVKAVTTDHGDSWDTTRIADDTVQNVRPVVPRDRHDDLPILWMRGSYTFFADAYETAIVGDDAE